MLQANGVVEVALIYNFSVSMQEGLGLSHFYKDKFLLKVYDAQMSQQLSNYKFKVLDLKVTFPQFPHEKSGQFELKKNEKTLLEPCDENPETNEGCEQNLLAEKLKDKQSEDNSRLRQQHQQL